MRSNALIGLLKEDLFLPDLNSETKEQVLEELVEVLFQTRPVHGKSIIIETLNNREKLGSTGIGKGIAIPHCCSLLVTEIFIIIGISKRGVSFDAVDKKKVHIFFLIIAPPQDKSNEYLPLLGNIVEIVKETKIRNAMLKAKDFYSFLEALQER